jgi:Tfp pilus assembly PilM family ATPase
LVRFLSLDWDYKQLHVVSATVGRGGVQVQQAAAWTEEASPNPGEAEALGQLLRERLKSAGIAPAPIMACVGRDRLIVKEVRYPACSANDEPALVRFQAVKELTDPADEVVIDYMPAGTTTPGGEQQALALIARRELVNAYQTLCKAAGLKLVALAPRPLGTIACLQQVVGTTVLTPPPDPPDGAVAVVLVTEKWAEMCISRGQQPLQSRALGLGPTLAGEVRRNISVHNGHAPNQTVKAVYVTGGAESGSLRDRLQSTLGVPVYLLDPFAGAERAEIPSVQRGAFTGAVGLLHAWAERRELPINFVHPKQPKPPKDPNKLRILVGVGAAAVLLIGAVFAGYRDLHAKDQEIERLYLAKSDLDKQLVQIEEDAKRIKTLDDWEQSEIVWLDELYDLTSRFPDPNLIRLTLLQCDPLSRSNKYVARMTLKGITTESFVPINLLQRRLEEESHYKQDAKELKANTLMDRLRFRQMFMTKVEMEKRPPTKYTQKLAASSDEDEGARRARGRQADEGEPGFFGFGGGMR